MGSVGGLDFGGEERGCDALEMGFDAAMDCDTFERDCVVLMGCAGALMGCGALNGSCALTDCGDVATSPFCPSPLDYSAQPKQL